MPIQTSSWDAFDRIFDEAFSRSKSRAGPFSPSPSDFMSPIQSPQYAPRTHAFAGATPYGATYPRGFSNYSDDSLGLTGIDDHYNQGFGDDPGDSQAAWDDTLHQPRKNTVVAATQTSTRRLLLPKSGLKLELESSGSKSTSTSNSSASPGLSSSPTSPTDPTGSSPPTRENTKSPTPKLKRRKSKVNFHDSADGKTVTATFDLQGVQKSDVHVSYQNDKVVISWESVSINEQKEGDRIIRERREKKYVRTLPLPEGTKFEAVKASMDGKRLTVTYPKYHIRRSNSGHEIDIGGH